MRNLWTNLPIRIASLMNVALDGNGLDLLYLPTDLAIGEMRSRGRHGGLALQTAVTAPADPAQGGGRGRWP
jgi:hypothetical protein